MCTLNRISALMMEKGFTQKQICDALKISKQTFSDEIIQVAQKMDNFFLDLVQ